MVEEKATAGTEAANGAGIEALPGRVASKELIDGESL